MLRRIHYEQAFEHYLRANRLPYVAVDEAKKALLPQGAHATSIGALKSFDFVVYGPARNLLIDIKGRRHAGRRGRHFESWVTREDVDALLHWEKLFGEGFEAAFVFVYWCASQPPDALFEQVFEFQKRWYALRWVRLADYRRSMQTRSPRWDTVSIPSATFDRIARPFVLQRPSAGSGGASGGPDRPCDETDLDLS